MRGRVGWLRALATFLGIAAVGCAVLGAILIRDGAYPPEGTGSLGHVGMTIAGIIAAFMALILGGLVLVCLSHSRTAQDMSGRSPDVGGP